MILVLIGEVFGKLSPFSLKDLGGEWKVRLILVFGMICGFQLENNLLLEAALSQTSLIHVSLI